MKLAFNFLGMILVSTLFLGCQGPEPKKEIVVKKVYVKEKVPVLSHFSVGQYKLTAINKGDKIYIKEWNATIDKKEFLKFIKYIKSLKMTLLQYKKEVDIYNDYAKKHNKELNSTLK